MPVINESQKAWTRAISQQEWDSIWKPNKDKELVRTGEGSAGDRGKIKQGGQGCHPDPANRV